MSNIIRNPLEKRKQIYIQKLLDAGIYKVSGRQLYNLTLSELENTYQSRPHHD
ncbi:Fur-regulated basic protein FbpA [Bacillus sp. APMAM]|uniref:Fur-regulated basic protein FbpA n=1 Tax=Margalitia sp. FSL K6-0131 TaxID=2954604 RepID=UPI000F88503F|nr:Fur-regulated basic protein FbpA [Bacillus sp. APMAM]RTZ57637.1 Fur-regulated basic protein FbpA [Bacillus sp. SAJ1]